MISFERVMDFTRTISSETAYSEAECRLLYESAMALESGAFVVEVGCEYGRSSSVLAQVGREKRLILSFIDPFDDCTIGDEFCAMLRHFDVDWTVYKCKTQEVLTLDQYVNGNQAKLNPLNAKLPFPRTVDLLHIDGDHTREGITTDCQVLLPLVVKGGVVLAHDYGRDSLPDVKPTLDSFLVEPKWKLEEMAETCARWRKVQ